MLKLKKFAMGLLLFLALSPALKASGTVTGTITTPSTSTPIRNGQLVFTLNQAGVDVEHNYVLVASPGSCYTDANGAVKLVPDALASPVVQGQVGTGSLAAGTYYVKLAYNYYNGTSYSYGAASPEVAVVLAGTGRLVVSAPVLRPGTATGYSVFISSTSGGEVLQGQVAGWTSFTQSTSLATATDPAPASNSTICTLIFNDSILPTNTRYRTNLLDSGGRQVAGWPRVYYFVGSTVNLATMTPTAATGEVQFPMPVLSNPLSQTATQSVNSALTLNQFNLTANGVILPQVSSNIGPQSGKTIIYTDTNGVAKVSENGAAAVNLVGGNGGWQINGSDIVETVASRAVLVGWSQSDLTVQGGGTLAGALVARNGVYVANIGTGSVDTSVDAHVLGIGVDDATQSAFIGSTVSGSQATGWPLTIKLCDPTENCATAGTHDWFKFQSYIGGGSGQFIAGDDETDASGAQGSVIGIGGVTAANNRMNAVLTRLKSTGGAGGRGRLVVDFTGSASYVPFDVQVSGVDVLELDGTNNATNTALLLYHNGMLKRVKMQQCLSDDMMTSLQCLTF